MVNVHNILKRPQNKSSLYRGRFAPSPSGLLHFGSLVAALASFLDAKANKGQWLIRIEDIDPPREMPGADKKILSTLEAYGLHWDEDVLYQSSQSEYYQQLLNALLANNSAYFCQCTRAQIKNRGGVYDGHCANLGLEAKNSAIRVINTVGTCKYHDRIQGSVLCDQTLANEDFIVLRKDGLFAYQLAVVADDIYQGITHVVRGCDLLEPTARQLSFYQLLKVPAPIHAHIPLATTEQGYKLSKQNKAPAIDVLNPQPSLLAALTFLGQKPPEALIDLPVNEIINWAIKHWQIAQVPKVSEIALS